MTRLDPNLTTVSPQATTEVTVSGSSTDTVRRALRAVHAKVLATVPGVSTAVVPTNALTTLSRTAGVSSVRQPTRAWVHAGESQGVSASNAGPASTAGTWQASGDDGAGVKIGIVDAGFAGLAAASANGDLPVGLTVVGNHCQNVDDTDHGTAVTEIAHEMAPGASLYLYCIDDAVGLNSAVSELESAGVTIVNSSLGFDGDSRGDGTGAPDSAAAAVRKARLAGILWISSAGNSGSDHWSGTFADADGDGVVDINGTGRQHESDGVFVPGTDDTGGAAGSAGLVVQWDQWLTSSAPVTLLAYGFQCNDDACDSETPINGGTPKRAAQQRGTAPAVGIDITNTSPYEQEWDVVIQVGRGFPKVRYDLDYEGDVSYSYLSSVNPARAAAGSVASPANSPYAFAVGASDVASADNSGNGACFADSDASTYPLETFSSQGPTIDGRVKPEISAYDGVTTPETNPNPFCGTSASAPHVAGAAALVAAANPSLDAAQLQNFLEQRAGDGSPANPPVNSTGHGLLTLGATPAATPVTAPVGAAYQSLDTPHRILDTRTTNGGHRAKLGAGQTLTVPVSSDIPSDATAVAINLTGVGANGQTFLSAYPGGTAFPRTSNLNLTKADGTAAVFAVVSIGTARTVTVRNSSVPVDVLVDEVGYFGTGSETGRYTSLAAPHRVLDTRTATGGHRGKVANGRTVSVNPAVPDDATAVIVNVTATGETAGGHLSAAPSCTRASSTLNYFKSTTRANLATVGLSGGKFCISDVGGPTDVLVDVLGYMGPSGAQYVAFPTARRIVDTRTGNGGSAGGRSSRALGQGTTTSFYASGVGDVPASASALLLGVTEASTTSGGHLSLFPGRTAPAQASSSVNFAAPGRVVANAAVTGLGSHYFGIYNAFGNTQAAVDVFGYFST